MWGVRPGDQPKAAAATSYGTIIKWKKETTAYHIKTIAEVSITSGYTNTNSVSRDEYAKSYAGKYFNFQFLKACNPQKHAVHQYSRIGAAFLQNALGAVQEVDGASGIKVRKERVECMLPKLRF